MIKKGTVISVLILIGVVYVVWSNTHSFISQKTSVKFNLHNYGNESGKWQTVGKPLRLTFHAHDLKLFSWKGNIFLAYTQIFDEKLDGFDQRLTILKWNGQAWIQFGQWDGLAELSKICVGSWKGKLCAVIAKSVYVKTNKTLELVQLVQWDKEKWIQTVRSFIFKKNFVFLSCFKIHNGIPYVGVLKPGRVLSDGDAGSLIKYTDHSWKYVGEPYFIKHARSGLSLAFLKEHPILACDQHSCPENSCVFKFNGTVWHHHLIKENGPGGSAAFLKVQGQLYLFLNVINGFDAATSNKILLMKYRKKKWIQISSVSLPPNLDNEGIFSFVDSLGNIYIAFSDNQEKATVLRFNGVRWNYLGKPSFSKTSAWPISFSEYKHRLYIAYADNRAWDVEESDHHSGKRIEVMRYIAPANKKSPKIFH